MNKIIFSSLTIFLTLFQFLQAHSPTIGVPRNITCVHPTPAKIYNWHFHLLYFQLNKAHTAGAMQIRDDFIATFKNRLGPKCTSLFFQDKLCMFEPDRQPAGPFPTAQWSVFIMPEDFLDVVSWIMQHKGPYDILVHPNTGCEMEDHSTWAMWGGHPWEINMDAFGHDQPFPWPKKVMNISPDGKSRLAFLSWKNKLVHSGPNLFLKVAIKSSLICIAPNVCALLSWK